ncbi:MAG: cell division protein FtsA [Flavobacteriales bacterium]|nr:cell division protein FtsA [Flavobacteriales bacterium]
MESNELIVGLDIGTTKIACMVGRKNEHGKLEILGLGRAESIGVKRGVVSNIEQTVQSIRQAVEEAELSAGVSISHVNVGIAGQHIRSLQHRGMITRHEYENEIAEVDLDMLEKDMYKLMMQPGEEIITVIPQEYIVDNEQGIKDPIGMSGVRLEGNFHIITGQLTAIKNIHRCVHKADLTVTGLTLEPLASAAAVLSEEEKEAGVVLVDIGGGTTDLAIFQDGIIRHTAVIPFGGNVITEDIKAGCTIMKKQAEALKVKFGSALPQESQNNDIICIPGFRNRQPKEISMRNLAHIIHARMEEIIDHIYYEISNSGYERQLIAGLVVTGGGSQLKHLQQLFEYVTGMDARVGYPNEHLANSNDHTVTSPMYATGVGLVIKGFEQLEKDARKGITYEHSRKDKGNVLQNFFNRVSSYLNEDHE